MHPSILRRLGVTASLALALLVLSALSACGGKSDTELVASAKSYLAKNDTKSAVIELKAALQKNPSSGEARFLLGDTFYKGGDPAAAVVELEKAQDLKYSESDVLPVLADALLVTGRAKKLTDFYGRVTLPDHVAAAALKATVADAYRVQGMRERSEAAINAALQLDPRNVRARLLQVRLTAGGGKIDQALVDVDKIIADNPKSPDAWQLKGELLWAGKADLDGATKAFRECLVLSPRDLYAHTALISLMLQKQDVPGFRAQLAELKKAAPNSIQAHFFDAQLALIDKDYKRARDGAQQLLKVLPENVSVLQLAGAIEFEGGSLLLAASDFTKALQLAPNLPLARRLLAETQLRSGEPGKALDTLAPLLSAPNPNAEVLSIAAQAHMQQGDLAGAENYFSQAAKVDPSDPKIRTALALAEIAKGNADTGFAQLELLTKDDKSTYADLALISARLRQGNLDAAMTAVDRLQAKLPDKPLPSLIRGRILEQRKDLAGARAAYDNALVIDKAYYPAIAALAGLDAAQGKFDAALKRFEDVLARDPTNYRALLAVVELRQRGGAKPAEIDKLLADAVRSHPDQADPRLMLIAHRLAQHDAQSALTAAQDAAAAMPDNLQVLDALGQAQLAAGDVQQAISAFGKVAAAQPTAPQPQLRLAQAFLQAKDSAGATRSLRKALEITPDYLPAQRALIQLALADKRVDDALKIARSVQKQRPKEAIGYLLEGEIQAGQKHWDPAIVALREALKQVPSTDVAVRLHLAYALAGRKADAERFASDWRREHPKDAVFVFQIATAAMGQHDYARAESLYRSVLALLPDNAAAMNNIAWLMVQQKEAGAATLAERAVKLAPQQPALMDTLALALAAENQLPKALDWQRKAVALAPEAPGYRLNLAKLLIQSGDRAAARTELDKLQALGSKFSGQDEVSALIKTL
ncbi:MAG: hypothetical protein ABT20_06835 [Rubrivivax sp. SCN 70-15]|nr:MAG: hypothetical protein ABT20_06835 [Rubrivivax sp. SCN 70-15]